jgi:hypothetical protein
VASGQGRVRLLNRDDYSFEYEITAIQGEFRVVITSYERWLHSAAKGDFEYPKSISGYMADVRQAIAQRIKDDQTKEFDVI